MLNTLAQIVVLIMKFYIKSVNVGSVAGLDTYYSQRGIEMKVALYARVSSARQDVDLSISA